MCGIAGIWQRNGQPVDARAIGRFIRSLAHRGPDGEGIAFGDGEHLALGHRRLAILDLTAAGSQPMASHDGRFLITYNGEIYNFLELRRELESKGARFRTETDTEVILAAFTEWGDGCLARLNGMWSFALWDHAEQRLLLSRDRFGVKPLYVTTTPGRVAFASELKAFLHLDGFHVVEDTETLRARLSGDRADGVLLRGVESVPAGHCLEIRRDGARQWRWWSTVDHLVAVPGALDDQAEQFRGLLFDACSLRARSDVPVASSLSGGLDSSSVVCALAAAQERGSIERAAPEWRRAYIAGFPGTIQDEVGHALAAAEHAGATPVLHPFGGGEIRGHLDAYLYQYEEIGGLYGLTSWLLYGAMRRDGVYVSLDGHGGDELLGGYGSHLLLALVQGRRLTSAPRRVDDLIRTLRALSPPGYPEETGGWARLALLTYPEVRAVARRVLASQRQLDELQRRHRVDPASAVGAAARELGPLTGVLYESFHRESLPRILRNFDAYSMGHGVEVRMPFLDWNVVCFGFSVPDESKAGEGYSKLLLRRAMRGVVPDALRLRRDKLGFTAPVAAWLQGGLADWLWEEVNDRDFLASELWDGPGLLALARAKRDAGAAWAHEEAHRVTMAVTANWWRTRWGASYDQRRAEPVTRRGESASGATA